MAEEQEQAPEQDLKVQLETALAKVTEQEAALQSQNELLLQKGEELQKLTDVNMGLSAKLTQAEADLKEAAKSGSLTAEAGSGMVLALFGRWLARRSTQLGPLGRDGTNSAIMARQLVERIKDALGVELPSVEEVEEAFEALKPSLPDKKSTSAKRKGPAL